MPFQTPTVTLTHSHDRPLPALGFGTWQLTGDDCYRSVQQALDVGYEHIDTAEIYGNQKEIGRALKEYPLYDGETIPENQKGVYRENLFVNSKVWVENFSHQQVLDACQRTLDDLGLDYLDSYLLHWPNKSVPIEETLEAMQHLKRQNKIKTIGVSNFTVKHLQDALKTGVEIAINQIEYHPSFQQRDVKDFCDDHGIVVTAYSPLGRGGDLKLPEVQDIAQKHQATPAQVVLSWILSQGMVTIPKSGKPEHIAESFQALQVDLNQEEIDTITGLERNNRLVKPDHPLIDY